MKLLIIQPSRYQSKRDLKPYKTRKRNLVGLALPYLAALTPTEWDIELIDQQVEDIDFGVRADLVAITTWTVNSLSAYEIADRFRAMGTPVIMGGPHTFFFGEEAAQHCDAVGIGEGEKIWPQMLEDASNGRL
ncbi:MAG: cobalamin-dependent protein, partial [Syntrophobacteraceae bacterium]